MDFRLTEPRLSPQQQTFLARAGLILLAAIVVMATLALVFTRSRREVPHPMPAALPAPRRLRGPTQLCNATSCRLAANKLKEALGSGNACDDFYSYVCSGWLHKPSFVSAHRTQMMLLSWRARSKLKNMAHGTQASSTSTRHAPIHEATVNNSCEKAAALYNECLKASIDHRADALAAFLRDVGLGFSVRARNPVALALELDLYYNVKTLFDLRLHPTWTRPDERPVLSMSVRSDMETWRRERENLRRHQSYWEFVQRYVVVVVAHDNGTDVRSVHDVDAIVRQVMATEETVLTVASAIPEEDPEQYYAVIDITVRNGSSSLPSSLDGLVQVAVGHPSMLAYYDFLSSRVPASDLVAYVTWETIRQLGPLADLKLSHGTASRSCFEAVYRLMPYPSVLPYLEELDSSRGLEEAELVFRDIAEALIVFMKRRGIAIWSHNTSFILGLPTASQMDALYGELQVENVSPERPFLDVYVSALSHVRGKELSAVAHGEPYYVRPAPEARKVQVTAGGKALVPVTMLLPPGFGADMPPALNYGGLGLALAVALARPSSSFSLDNAWLECLWRTEPRADLQAEGSTLARLVLATEVVVEFVDQHSELARPLVLPGLEYMSEEMLFFVGACVSLCARGDALAPHLCNMAARNSARFASAFSCPAGTYMNPRERCPYPNLTLAV